MPRERKSQRATIHDVAARAGVSAATVSKVLRGVSSVRAENAARVHEAVAALDYRMDPLAAGLRHERRRILAAVVPDLESPFFGALATGLERAAEAAGYHMILASSRESERREADLIARMDDWRVSGTVLAPVRSERGQGAAMLDELGMTAVLVDRVSAHDRFDSVTADNFHASAHVADVLHDAGHRHVLLHGATRLSKAVRTRVEGFTARAAARDPELRVDTLLSDEGPEAQRVAIARYFEDARPTAVFSLSQHSTLIVLSEIRRRGIRCPDEISLVGFDDADWMQTTWPTITAVAQPIRAMAEQAVAALLERVEGAGEGKGGGTAAGAAIQRLEPCELRVRQSLGPAPGAAGREPGPPRRRAHP